LATRTLYGTAGDDILLDLNDGGSTDLNGLDGNGKLFVLGINDFLYGGLGYDELYGGQGSDVFKLYDATNINGVFTFDAVIEYDNEGIDEDNSAIVVFIDPSVSDSEILQAGVIAGIEVITLSQNQDGIQQITNFLQQHPQITTIHIVSHGAPGCLYLGNSQLNWQNIHKYGEYLQSWQRTNGNLSIYLYGCNVAAGDAGEEFIAKLHQVTGAKIAASAKRIGNVALRGSWELEVSTPTKIAPSLAFCADTLATYQGVFRWRARF
jgi:hypothetical protein